jgi:eukaryotic-like serine/threonine-protein kinase
MTSPHNSNPWIGRSLGDNQRYRLDRRLGGGGMGDVFLATDLRVGQQVALKLLKDNLVESPEMRQRFEHEIAICAALPNQHIVQIMDAGVTPEGYPFYVMEYLRGFTLGELLRDEHRLSVDRTVKIISQICNGLLLAHQGVNLPSGEYIEAVIHRDLKPDNIFLQPTDLGEWVKIVDFGIAKILYKDEDRPQTLTHTFLGTLRYASPEQMMGDRDLDARSDIYSLGVILYEMLSGADPFGFSIKPRPMSEASWIIAHTSGQPISLRSQPGCEQLSPDLEAVTLRCLEKQPDLRFGSVAELNLALQAAITAPPPGANRGNAEGRTIVQPRPVVPTGTNEETIAKAILPPTSDPSETISRPLAPLEPFGSATHEATISPPLPSPFTGASIPPSAPIVTPPAAENIVLPSPLSPPVIEGGTQVQPRPPALNNMASPLSPSVIEGGTQVQARPSVAETTNETPSFDRSQVRSIKPKTPWVKIALGVMLGIGSICGIYLFTQSRTPIVVQDPGSNPIEPSPPIVSPNPDPSSSQTPDLAAVMKLVDEGKLEEAIASANKIPQNSPAYQQAQTLSADAARLSTAVKLANEGKLQEAIELGEKILPTSPIYKKVQAYLREWKEV